MRAWRMGHHDRALAEADDLLQYWPDNPRLLVLRGCLIQLQAAEQAPPLKEARATLERAVSLDDESPASLLELGHFLFAVEDDAKSAARAFDKAIQLCKRILKDALLGKAKTLAELRQREQALACLAEAYWLESQDGSARRGSNGSAILEELEALRLAE
jgi:predicted Zn-dependent protease